MELHDLESCGWLLCGEPVVAVYGRDYDTTTDQFLDWAKTICREYQVKLEFLEMTEPEGLVLQAYKGEAPKLIDPLIKVTKKDFPFLFCAASGCRHRISPLAPVGTVCSYHLENE